jgi:hypothetical protein
MIISISIRAHKHVNEYSLQNVLLVNYVRLLIYYENHEYVLNWLSWLTH